MSVTCGFYNSFGGDRKYDATQLSRLFDGVFQDGIFASIGDCFVVTANSGNTVNVGTGRCWFNHTWTENDAVLPIDCGEAHQLYNRIDAIVIEVDPTEETRDNTIKLIKGADASNPVNPTLPSKEGVYQYPLCYIYRAAGSSEILPSNITNMVGSEETPFITGVIDVLDLATLLRQWQGQLDDFVASEEKDMDAFMTAQEKEFEDWYAERKRIQETSLHELDTWIRGEEILLEAFIEDMKDQLSEEAESNLWLQRNTDEINRILLTGFVDGTKVTSSNGRTITSTDSSGRKLVKSFSDDYLTITTKLYSAENIEIGRLVKTMSSDGSKITLEHWCQPII